ncbi:oxygenase [Lithospermum erythrorhizon]|uniref:Oxygenase n=1 Tax=Lithospermum erythrorhizon TaxID=34254 RepID=A0AAV3QPN8_LITER
MKRLKNEIKEVLNGKKDITDSDLVKMQYLKCVIKETLRLHPPIPLLVPRIARADTKIMGYDIGIGTWVMINAWTIGREVGYWDEPEEFKPERFLDSKVDFIGHDFQLIPFGAGRRGCPGISFAIATNEIVLANLVHRFDWKLPNGVEGEDLDMTERPSVTIARKFPLLTLAKPC